MMPTGENKSMAKPTAAGSYAQCEDISPFNCDYKLNGNVANDAT